MKKIWLPIYFLPILAFAQNTDSVLSAFRYYRELNLPAIPVPHVVEVPLPETLGRFDLAVRDEIDQVFVPTFFRRAVLVQPVSLSVSTNPTVADPAALVDGNFQSRVDFPFSTDQSNTVSLKLTAAVSITSSRLTLNLDDYVALPRIISLRAETSEGERVIIAARPLDDVVVTFPRTTAKIWTIVLDYAQPLRLTELRLEQENAPLSSQQVVRFLAQPGRHYRLYFDADRTVRVPVGEASNLADDEGVLRIEATNAKQNSLYRPADVDTDGVIDLQDNCIDVSNPDQIGHR